MPTRGRHPVYHHPLWRRTRGYVLRRDGGICQLGAEGCTRRATEVDHIVPLAEGGAPFDLDNLRAACKHCNSGRAKKRQAELARMALRQHGSDGASTLRAW